MKFVTAVQKGKIHWPTQRKFESQAWFQKAEELCEDDADTALFEAGVWVSDTLENIRGVVETLSIWNLPWELRAQYLLALCNRDLAILRNKTKSLLSDKQAGAHSTLSLDEDIFQSVDQKLYGSGKASALVEGAVDAIHLALIHKNPNATLSSPYDKLTDLGRAVNYAIAYQITEGFFYRAVWLEWRVVKVEDHWKIFPNDRDAAKLWEASWLRFEQLLGELSALAFDKWNNDSALRRKWLMETQGTPKFTIQKRYNSVRIKYTGKARQPTANDFINENVINQAYYTPFLEEPLPLLNGQCMLDLLEILTLLGTIVEKVLDTFSENDTVKKIEEIATYCPLISLKNLISSISQATGMEKKNIHTILEALTWSRGKELWFHPLIQINVKGGPALLFTALPLTSPNLYRFIDYWLLNLGLTVERRGHLFEQQIECTLLDAASQAGLSDEVKIIGSQKIRSNDTTSEEEVDSIILMNDLLIIGEAKCQTLPTTPQDNQNYLQTLHHGANQAKRKAQWVKNHLDEIAQILEVEVDSLSGKVEPVVIINHSVGAGLIFEEIPILDLQLLKNYLVRPYLSQGRMSSKGFKETQTTLPYYTSKKEMADKFHSYATNSFFLNVYKDKLEAQWKEFALRNEKVFMLEFMVHHE